MGGNGWKYGKGRLEVDGGRLLVDGEFMRWREQQGMWVGGRVIRRGKVEGNYERW